MAAATLSLAQTGARTRKNTAQRGDRVWFAGWRASQEGQRHRIIDAPGGERRHKKPLTLVQEARLVQDRGGVGKEQRREEHVAEREAHPGGRPAHPRAHPRHTVLDLLDLLDLLSFYARRSSLSRRWQRGSSWGAPRQRGVRWWSVSPRSGLGAFRTRSAHDPLDCPQAVAVSGPPSFQRD